MQDRKAAGPLVDPSTPPSPVDSTIDGRHRLRHGKQSLSSLVFILRADSPQVPTRPRSAKSGEVNGPANAKSRQAKALSTQRGPAHSQMVFRPSISTTRHLAESKPALRGSSCAEDSGPPARVSSMCFCQKRRRASSLPAQRSVFRLRKNHVILLSSTRPLATRTVFPPHQKLGPSKTARSHHQTATTLSSHPEHLKPRLRRKDSLCLVQALPLRDSLMLPSLQLARSRREACCANGQSTSSKAACLLTYTRVSVRLRCWVPAREQESRHVVV